MNLKRSSAAVLAALMLSGCAHFAEQTDKNCIETETVTSAAPIVTTVTTVTSLPPAESSITMTTSSVSERETVMLPAETQPPEVQTALLFAEAPKQTEKPVKAAAVVKKPAALVVMTSAPRRSDPSVEGMPACGGAAVYCIEDNRMLYSFSANDRVSLASTTKTLTALTALKYMKPNTLITVGNEIRLAKAGSSLADLKTGYRLTLEQLLYGLMLPSGNDAAYAIAVAVGRAVSPGENLTMYQAVTKFVGLMNSYAAEIGMTGSRFANPEGWDDSQHYSTAADLVKLVKKAMSCELLRNISVAKKAEFTISSGEEICWECGAYFNIPESEHYRTDLVFLKPGFTKKAKYSVLMAVKNRGKNYVIVVMGCETNAEKYAAVELLAERFIGPMEGRPEPPKETDVPEETASPAETTVPEITDIPEETSVTEITVTETAADTATTTLPAEEEVPAEETSSEETEDPLQDEE